MAAPPVTAPPYDTLNFVLGSVRTRLNDLMAATNPVSGKILLNTTDFSQQSVNTAWRKFQDSLADRGYQRLLNEVVISALPVVASSDPASQTWISWDGYFDGVTFTSNPRLPADLAHPLKIWERWTGQNAQFSEPPMEKMLDGLPATLKTTNIRFWEWRGDAIYFPGSQISEDIRVRYVSYLPDFQDNVASSPPQRWWENVVPIMHGSDALSWYICSEFVGSRGDQALALDFTQKGEAALSRIFNLDVRADSRVNIRRKPRSGRGFGRDYY